MNFLQANNRILPNSRRFVSVHGKSVAFLFLSKAWFRYSVLAILIALYFLAFQYALIDDAFISLDYAKTIVTTGRWGLTPMQVTNTATSPLNVILMALLARIMGISTRIPIWLTVIGSLVSIHFLEKISLRLFNTRFIGTTGALLLIFNPLLLSTLGMECFLFATLTITALNYFQEKRWYVLAFVLGLLSLTRPDGTVYAVVFLFFLPSMKVRLKYVAVYIITVLPWLVISWVYLGSFIPDTFFIKTLQNTWGDWNYSNGITLYWERFPLETGLSLIFLPGLVLFMSRRVRQMDLIKILLLSGLAHYAGYSLLHVAPYHWYYAPEVINLTLIACLGFGILSQTQSPACHVFKWIPGFILLALAAFQVFWLGEASFNVTEMPIHTNRATREQYQEIGQWINDNCGKETIRLEGEIGTLSYYSDCSLLDWFSDRRWLIRLVNDLEGGDGAFAQLLRFNFRYLERDITFPPETHLLTAHIDRNRATGLFTRKWETSTRWTPNSLVTYGPLNGKEQAR